MISNILKQMNLNSKESKPKEQKFNQIVLIFDESVYVSNEESELEGIMRYYI